MTKGGKITGPDEPTPLRREVRRHRDVPIDDWLRPFPVNRKMWRDPVMWPYILVYPLLYLGMYLNRHYCNARRLTDEEYEALMGRPYRILAKVIPLRPRRR